MNPRPSLLAVGLLLSALMAPVSTPAADDYVLGTESTNRTAGVPAGRVEKFRFTTSKVFEGTERDGWVYIPAQYDPAKPAALMVFQDGHAYVSTNGQMRVPIVFDNLIAKGDMPVTIGVFINPGNRSTNNPPAEGWGNRSNRSVEYDSLGDAYPRFLIDELLPFVETTFKVRFSTDPAWRGICGMSSGGICAFTAAWERPDSFGKVLSHIGSFTNIRGGHAYAALARKTARKPIRVFLQDGSNDLNNEHGSWPLGNQQLALSLGFAGYDVRLDYGDGAHNGKHGGAILPDSLRWLWRPVMHPAIAPTPGTAQLPLAGEWELVGEGYGFTDGTISNEEGLVAFSDMSKGRIYVVDGTGADTPLLWLDNGPKVSGMKFGADGLGYACVQGTGTNNTKRIVAVNPGGKDIETVATGVNPNDIVVTKSGWVYFTDTGAGAVVRVPTSARGLANPSPAAAGIRAPNGIALSPDQKLLYVSEYQGTNVWTFRIAEDGSLRGGERTMRLLAPAGRPDSGGDGMITDAQGRLWVTSHLGIQVFEANGTPLGIVPRPQEKNTVSCTFGGADGAYLFAASSDKVYRRKTRTHRADVP